MQRKLEHLDSSLKHELWAYDRERWTPKQAIFYTEGVGVE